MIIPYYTRNLQVDFTCAVPVKAPSEDRYDIGMYVHPNICLLFKNIWSTRAEALFDVKHFMETTADLDCKNFDERYESFVPFRRARVQRRFEERRNSIFFDEEEVEVLSATLQSQPFTSLLEVYINGEMVPLEKIPKNLYQILRPYLVNAYNAVEMLNPDEYRRYCAIRKLSVYKGGVGVMDRRISLLKVLGGTLLAGAGIMFGVLGGKKIYDGIVEMQYLGEAEEDE